MDHELDARLKALEDKIERVYVSAEKTRKYILAVVIVTVIAFVLPLIGLLFAIPAMLSSYAEILTL